MSSQSVCQDRPPDADVDGPNPRRQRQWLQEAENERASSGITVDGDLASVIDDRWTGN
ncbi:MAG: hypothetical protein MI923_01320 [Phycisphaerales bacterium]|nr:hypothetical protein [Phycisphaerales bacterium]